jgi:hypothetical protein
MGAPRQRSSGEGTKVPTTPVVKRNPSRRGRRGGRKRRDVRRSPPPLHRPPTVRSNRSRRCGSRRNRTKNHIREGLRRLVSLTTEFQELPGPPFGTWRACRQWRRLKGRVSSLRRHLRGVLEGSLGLSAQDARHQLRRLALSYGGRRVARGPESVYTSGPSVAGFHPPRDWVPVEMRGGMRVAGTPGRILLICPGCRLRIETSRAQARCRRCGDILQPWL